MISFRGLLKNNLRFSLVSFIITLIIVTIGSLFPVIIKSVIDMGINSNNSSYIFKNIVIFGVLIVAQLLLNYFLSVITARCVQEVVFSLRKRIYKIQLANHYDNHTQKNDSIQTAIISDCEVIGSTFQQLYIGAIVSMMSLILCSTLLLWLNWRLFVLIIGVIPIFAGINFWLGNLTKKYFLSIQGSKDKLLNHLTQTIHGIFYIRLYKVESDFFNSFSKKSQELRDTEVHFNTITSFLSSIINFLSIVAPFLVLLAGGFLVIRHVSTLGNIIASYSYSSSFFDPMGTLLGLIPLFKQFSSSALRINSILGSPLEVKVPYSNFVSNNDLGNSAIVLKDVTLYHGSKKVISNFSYRFERKGSYLVTGPNGSGKSTLACAMSGLFENYSGRIDIADNVKISYIPQETYLFDGSILDNMTMGLKKYDNNSLEKYLQVTKFYDSNVDSLDVYVNSQQKALSTGQMQKIKLIHGLLSKPTVLILDEILSNVDLESQNSILNFLSVWSDTHMIIVIAHDDARVISKLSPIVLHVPAGVKDN